MSNAVRSPVLGEQVPLFVILGLAIIGVLSALLTTRALAERASKNRSRAPSQELARPASPAPTPAATPAVETAAAAPSPASIEPPEPSTPVPAEQPAPDCPEFPGFAFRAGRSKPVDNLDDAVGTLVAWMQHHPEAVLIVEGHADATGGPKLNLSLSFDRAREVAKLFTSQGLDPLRIDVEAYGAFRPVGRGDGPSAVDRRVSLRTGGEPACPHREGNKP